MHWDLRKDEKFGSIKLLELKNTRGDQIIETFYKIGSPQKLGPASFISRNFKTLKKVLLNDGECFKMWWMTMNLGLQNVEGGSK